MNIAKLKTVLAFVVMGLVILLLNLLSGSFFVEAVRVISGR